MKANSYNDGTRSLFESILVPEVSKAFKDWKKETNSEKYVLIGGIVLSYYTKPRTTTDVDTLFLSVNDIPIEVSNFKRSCPGAFLHKETHVEIEVLTPNSINISSELANQIYNNANIRDEIRIASPSGLVASKLKRFKLQDQADIEALLQSEKINLSNYSLSSTELSNYEKLKNELNK